jgi:hypothetical protein
MNQNITTILFFITTVFYTSTSKSAACETTQTGLWSDPNTWTNCAGFVPIAPVDSATIKTGHSVTFDFDAVDLEFLSMETGSELIIQASANDKIIRVINGAFAATLGQVTLQDDLLIEGIGQQVQMGMIDGNHNLVINTPQTTRFARTIGSTTPLMSITTDAPGQTNFTQNYSIALDGATDSVFNDNITVGASARITWNHNGTGDLVFQGTLNPTSGSPQQMVINKNSGNIAINDDLRLGRFETNGSAPLLLNANMETFTGGANNGDMILNTPVVLGQNVSLTATGGAADVLITGNITGDGMGSWDLSIDSSNTVSLADVSQAPTLQSVSINSGTLVTFNGDLTLGALSITPPAELGADVSLFTALTPATFTGGLNGQNHDLLMTVGISTFDFFSNTNGISQVAQLTVDSTGSVLMNGGSFNGASHLVILPILEIFAPSNITVDQFTSDQPWDMISDFNLSITQDSLVNGSAGGGSSNTLTKLGNGRLLLPSTSTWSGGVSITVSEGELVTDATHNHVLMADGTGTIAGAGQLTANTLQLNDNAALSPGDGVGDTDTFILDGLTMSASSELIIDLSGSPALAHDQVQTTGGLVTLAGDLTLRNAESAASGDSFTLIDNTGPAPITGTFNGLSEGATVGISQTISYVGGDGNDVVLSTFCSAQAEVQNGADTGAGSLREAVADVCDGGVITFGPAAQNIVLTTPITIDKTVTLSGTNESISGGDLSQVFDVTANGDLSFNLLKIINANSGFGAIRNDGLLTITNSYFQDNFSSGAGGLGGGAIINNGTTSISNSVFYHNNAQRGGALVNADGGVLTVTNSTFFENGNTFVAEGGVIHNRGDATFIHSTMVDSGDGDVPFGNTISVFGVNASTTLINSVISSPSAQSECNSSTDGLTVINTFIDDGSCTATFSGDAMLDVWQSIPSRGFVGDSSYVIPPLAGSPLVNAADAVACVANDALGTVRPQGIGCDIGAIELTDDVAPAITQVQFNDQAITACDQLSENTLNALHITFSERMEETELLSSDNYDLIYAGPDFNFDIKLTPPDRGSDDVFLSFNSIVSDGHATNPTVSLDVSQDLEDGLYMLFVYSDLIDEFFNPLNEGQTEELMFRIDQGNLLVNGHFDDCDQASIIDNGWTYQVTADRDHTEDTVAGLTDFSGNFYDINASFFSGSVEVQTQSSSQSYEMYQCADLDPGLFDLPLELSAYLRAETGGPAPRQTEEVAGDQLAQLSWSCQLFDQAACMGNFLTLLTDSHGLFDLNDTQLFSSAWYIADPQALSVQCQLGFTPIQDNQISVLADGIRLQQADLIFENGFEFIRPINNGVGGKD